MPAAACKRLRKYFRMQLNLVIHPSRALTYMRIQAQEFLSLLFEKSRMGCCQVRVGECCDQTHSLDSFGLDSERTSAASLHGGCTRHGRCSGRILIKYQ